jgi:acetyltransferase-like isoleucine patch superfamily enzyme
LSLPDGVKLGAGCVVDDGVVLGYEWTQPAPDTVIGEASRIRTGAIVYAGARIGARAHIGHHALVRQGSVLGDDCSVGTRSVVEHEVTIGDRVRIHSSSFIPEHTVIEDDAWIGPMVCVTNARYPMMGPPDSRVTGVTIKRGAKIGGGAVLLPGITIGERALVGAGSVVTKDVAPGTVVAGNPARAIGDVESIEQELSK